MLSLNDGRKQLYQWDAGRTASVSIDCDIIHFSNLTYGEALAVQVKNGEVEIPNQLLTSGSPVYCWAFVLDENGAYTKQEQTIDVIKRGKPSDYVYTQTEVVTIQSAVENALEQAKESGAFKGDKGDKGDPYTLTDTDKNTIADAVKDSLQSKEVVCEINDGISVIDTGLTYSRGVVEVRRIGSILWVVDSGVYNFTADFKQSNNRTVLQLNLPKEISNKLHNVNGIYGGTGTIGYFPALAYENVTYTTFNCQSYLKRYAIGDEYDTFQLVYTGLSAISGGGLCGFHLKMPLFLIDAEEREI